MCETNWRVENLRVASYITCMFALFKYLSRHVFLCHYSVVLLIVPYVRHARANFSSYVRTTTSERTYTVEGVFTINTFL